MDIPATDGASSAVVVQIALRPLVVAFINRLPFELLSWIFDLTLGNIWTGPPQPSYVLRRFYLATVCVRWKAVVRETSSFWNKFLVHSSSSIHIVRSALSLAGPRDLFFKFTLGPCSGPADQQLVSTFHESFSRCTYFSLTFVDWQSMHSIVTLLHNAPLRQVKKLYLICLRGPGASQTITPLDIERGFPRLEELTVVGVPMLWTMANSFRSLRTLLMRNLKPAFAPDWDVWQAIATVAPGLERLCMQNIGCHGIPDFPVKLVFFHLVCFDITVQDDDNSTYLFVSVIYAPNLRCLAIRADSSSFLHPFLSDPLMLGGVKCLTLRLSDGVDTDIYRFLSTTPNVQHLDLFDDDEPILDVLCIPTSTLRTGPTFLCPRIVTMTVTERSPKRLRSLIELRSAALDALVFSQGYIDTGVYEDDLWWLEDRCLVKLFGSTLKPKCECFGHNM